MIVRKPTPGEIETANSWSTWSKGPSEFSWSYDANETCYILEGEAIVKDSKGNSIRFGPGDWVEFKEGLEYIWTISKTIRKKYMLG